MSEELGITIQNHCYECMVIARDMAHDLPVGKCQSCQDLADARLADDAHELVDDGNLQYKHQWFINREQASGHDWTERDGEFLPPVALISDGGTYEELWELDYERQLNRETECPWCHLMTPKIFPDCTACDKTLESNVR